MPIFDNDCFGTDSKFFIPAFKSRRNATPTNAPETAKEAMRKRMDELTKQPGDEDHPLSLDPYSATNLLAKSSCTATTATSNTNPPLDASSVSKKSPTSMASSSGSSSSFTTTSLSDTTRHDHATSHPAPTELKPSECEDDNAEQEQCEELADANEERGEEWEHERVAREVEVPPGEYTPPAAACVDHNDEHDYELGVRGAAPTDTLARERRGTG